MQELQGKTTAMAALQSERDQHMRSAQERCRELSTECNHRRSCQEQLARQLAQRDLELAVMRLQSNNQRLGTVVQKFSSGGIEPPQEAFEPGFSYHQLQQVRFSEDKKIALRSMLAVIVHLWARGCALGDGTF